MKRIVLTGILALATGLSGLMAQTAAPAQQGTAAQPKVPAPKSQAEGQAIMAVQTAGQSNDPDAIIKAVEDLITKFADTDFKEWAISLEAKAYQMKRDDAKAQVYAEQALAINPKAYQMTLLAGEVISAHIGDHDLNRAEKMTQATKYFNDTVENLKTATKPNAAVPDDQWDGYKKALSAEAHNGLGTLALLDKKWDVAVSEFKTAYEGDPQDAYGTRMAQALQSGGKNDEAIALCDKLLANPQIHPVIKDALTRIKASATAAKGK